MLEQGTLGSARLMTIQGAANYLGVSISTLRRMDRGGVLVPIRTPGGHRRYTRDMLDEFVDGSKAPSRQNADATMDNPDQTGLDHEPSHQRDITTEQELVRLRKQLDEIHALQQATLDGNTPLKLPEFLEMLVRQASQLLRASGGIVYLRSASDAPGVEAVVSYNLDQDYRGTRLKYGEGVSGRAAQSGQPAIAHDYGQWLGRSSQPADSPPCTAVAIPLISRGHTYGTLEIIDLTGRCTFTGNDLDVLMPFAYQATFAIENAQLHASAYHLGQAHQAYVAQLSSLQATSLRLSSTFELKAVLHTLAEGALELTPAEDTHIYFYDQHTDELAFGTALWRDGRREPAVVMPRADGLTATVARSGKPLFIDNAPNHAMFSDRVSRQWGVHAIAGFPLKRQERVIGVFNVTYLSPHKFSTDEIRILNLLADQAAVAIENARLYQQVQAHRERLEAEVASRTLQLRQEKERGDAILTHAADGVVLTNAQGVIEYVNPSWERLTGYSAEQAIHQNPRILKSGVTPPELYEEMWQTITAAEVWRGQLRNRRADGSLYDVDLTIAPVMDGEGHIVNFVGVHRDITGLKELERLKDEFVSNVSHELRTPIANLKLYQNLLEQGKPDRRREYLQVINRETTRLEQLVADLLDLSRLERGSIALSPELSSLNALAADVVHRLLKLSEERQVTLELIQAPKLPPVRVDLHKMTQVLTNLIVNALNYTPAGGQVTVETAQETRGNQAGIRLIVQDTGIGIAPGDQEHIFERFFRAQAARETGVPGTGLGLAIAKEIVDLHNGLIEVKSALNEGSTFAVWLPISQ